MLEGEAREAIARFDAALAAVREAAAGQTGRLRVGFEAAGAGRLSTQSRARFLARFPHVRVEPRRYDWGGEVAGLREGECDVAFVWLPADLTGLKSELVASEPRFAGVATTHALAAGVAVGERADRRADHVDAPRAALLGRLVGREPAPGRPRAALGTRRTRTSRRCSSRSPTARPTASSRPR